MIPPVPRRAVEELRQAAELFLNEYHPSGEIPIPIEEIIELDMGLEIRPVRGFRRRFNADGSLTVDLQTILVDESLLTRYPNRYRFTLAHEIGHWVLHAEQVKSLAGGTPEAWKEAVREIPAREYGLMESQAYTFAGYVLVPQHPLLDFYQQAARRGEEHGIDLAALQDMSLEYVAGWIAREFDVSTEVVMRQLRHEGIIG